MTMTLIATTTMGFESVLAREVRALGFQQVRVFDNKVEFEGDDRDLCLANLCLRTAGRIYIKVAEFKAETFDALFEQTKALHWARWIQKDDQFPVSYVSSRKSTLFAKSDCQAIVKKAVVESLKASYKVRTLPERRAKFPIRIQLDKDIATLSIDSSGSGLNRRGYRAQMDRAPLRETLAAGLVLLSRWRPNEDVLLDPFCGTGTILIEAGLIAKNIAPGLNRRFLAEEWTVISSKHWADVRREAKAAIKREGSFRIYGSDHNPRALSIARENIKLAGLSDIHVQKRALDEISSRFERGRIITNPPYGERLGEAQDVETLYKEMGQVFRARFADWSYYILTSQTQFESLFGAKSTKHRKLFNGGLECRFYQYFASK